MQKAKFWLLAIGAFLVVVALAITGFTERKGKPEAGSPEQMAKAREAKKKKAKVRAMEDEEEDEDEDENFIPETDKENEKESSQSENN